VTVYDADSIVTVSETKVFAENMGSRNRDFTCRRSLIGSFKTHRNIYSMGVNLTNCVGAITAPRTDCVTGRDAFQAGLLKSFSVPWL